MAVIINIISFLAVCPSAQASHITAWLNRHVPSTVQVQDVTSNYCILAVMGPKARRLLQLVTKTDLGTAAFPFGTSQVCVFFKSAFMDYYDEVIVSL